jgi:hypothetical protein
MGISGSLKDVSVTDVMQFIHLGRRTGTLLLARGAQRAMIGFHAGRLVSAQAPRTPKLGDLLISSGLVERAVLDEAILRQGQEREHRSLGQMLIASGAIDGEGLRRMIAQQIEQAVSEVIVWDNGTFEFAIDDLRPIDDIALYPGDVWPDADLNTQMVLLEAARIFDERNRGGPTAATGASEGAGDPSGDAHHSGALPAPSPYPGTGSPVGDSPHPTLHPPSPGGGVAVLSEPRIAAHAARIDAARAEVGWAGAHAARLEPPKHAAERLHLQIVSSDHAFASVVGAALRHEVAGIESLPFAQAGGAAPGEPPPIVLLDLRPGGVALEVAAALRRARPHASIIALVAPETSFAKVYETGVLTAVPAEVAAVTACVENVIESRADLLRGRPRGGVPSAAEQSGVARLRRVFGDLRSGLISATVALNLMHIISESVERAVLFLVKRDHLVALGAFGADAAGHPLAELTRGLRLSAAADNVFSRSLNTSEVQSLDVAQADLPEPFRSLVGRSRTGQVVVFPVLGAQRVIAVIYTDNGDREEPIEDIDILELATAQVGMAFENELLRRQISQGKES